MEPAAQAFLRTQIDTMQKNAEQSYIEAEKTIDAAMAQLAKIAEEAQKNDHMKG